MFYYCDAPVSGHNRQIYGAETKCSVIIIITKPCGNRLGEIELCAKRK